MVSRPGPRNAAQMAREIRVATEIDAPPRRVWRLLIELDGYHLWNPCVDYVIAHTGWSTRLRLRLNGPGRRPVRLIGGLLEVSEPKVLLWAGGHAIPGLLSVTHTIVIRPTADNGTVLEQAAKVRGLLKGRGARAAETLMIETGAAAGRALTAPTEQAA